MLPNYMQEDECLIEILPLDSEMKCQYNVKIKLLLHQMELYVLMPPPMGQQFVEKG